jgi:predicted dehydrogenase
MIPLTFQAANEEIIVKLRVGVVGTGHWATEVHVPGVLASSAAECVGVYGRATDKARDIATRYGIGHYPTLEALLDDCDAVTIAVPPATQPVLAMAAALAGKHLLLEKPVALREEAATGLARVVAAKGTACHVFFTRRYAEPIEAAIADLAGRRWTRARATVHSAAMSSDTPYRESRWRQAGGAALWDIGPHVLSIVLAAMGPATAVRCESDGDPPTVSLFVRHASGSVTEASLTLHADPRFAATEYRFESPDETFVLPLLNIPYPELFASAVDELASAAVSGAREHRCDLRLGVETVCILAAAERSAAAGCPIALDAASATQPWSSAA